MKKSIKIFLGMIICCFMFSITAFANEDEQWEQVVRDLSIDTESLLLPEGVNQSIGYGNNARGKYLSSATLSITNKGYGVIGIYGNVLVHKPVKKIRMNIFLDRWDEDAEDWFQVDAYRFLYEYEEGGEDLTSISESFSVTGFPTGCYYRLRGICGVWSFEGGLESQGPITNGILITNGPA